jgi:hypothetical protein
MRCVVCGAAMRLQKIVPAKIIRAPGYEHRSFRCLTCSAVERRLAFTPQKQFCFISRWRPSDVYELAGNRPQ